MLLSEADPYVVNVEEAKVSLTELIIAKNEAELVTFDKMLLYIQDMKKGEQQNEADVKNAKDQQPLIELIHIFVLKEYILQDEIIMG